MAFDWKLIYDIADDRDPGPKIALGLVLACATGVVFWFLRAQRRGEDVTPALFFGFMTALIFVFASLLPALERRRLLAAAAEGRVQRVEGVVSGYRLWEQQASGNGQVRAVNPTGSATQWEAVTVGGVSFQFLAHWYEREMERRGVAPVAFRDGLRLRLTYVGDNAGEPKDRRMVRLEWADDGAGAASSR